MDGHIQTPVTINIDDQPVRTADLCPDGRRQAKAHRSKSSATEKGAWLAHLVVLHCPHLMLPNAEGHEGIAVSQVTEEGNGILRREFTLVGYLQRILFLQVSDVSQPF